MLPIGLVFGFAVSIALEPRRPTRWFLQVVRTRGAGAGAVTVAYLIGLASLSTCKAHIPDVVPFYADRFLADAERAVLGTDAWRLAHAAPVWLGSLVLWLYQLPWLIYWTGGILVAAWLPPSRLRTQYVWSYFLTIFVLGIAVAAGSASVGPIFYDRFFGGDRFADLAPALDLLPIGRGTNGYAQYLLRLYETEAPGLGSGISAFPSIHCAAVVLNALFLSRFGRGLGVAGWFFAASIFFGSIYTGWHYATDGVASLIGVVVIWLSVDRILQKTDSDLSAET
nr:phosphatase PAP2 family protein [Parvularcula dongshanensis]